jgi:hypothetical protein
VQDEVRGEDVQVAHDVDGGAYEDLALKLLDLVLVRVDDLVE